MIINSQFKNEKKKKKMMIMIMQTGSKSIKKEKKTYKNKIPISFSRNNP